MSAKEYRRRFDKTFSLEGKVALITGAFQGIGRAVADLFAEKGSDLTLIDMNDAIGETAQEIAEATGRRIVPVTTDLTDFSAIKQITETALSEFGKIDILVNNAGVVLLEDAEKISEAYWDDTMAINLKAPFLLAQAVGNAMIEQGGGKIINMASQAGMIALDRHVAYCVSKAGIIEMTKVLAYEWGEYNINVNAISPTVVLTELGRKAWAGEVGEAMKKKIPIGRFCDPEEIAAAALYLASDASDMITGANLVIDGGFTIQ